MPIPTEPNKTIFTTLNNGKAMTNQKDFFKTLRFISFELIFSLLSVGVPEDLLQLVLTYALNYCKPRKRKFIFESKKREFRTYFNKCAICGASENLQIHHIKSINTAPYLKFNPNNWIVLCNECHKTHHNYIYKQFEEGFNND